MAIRSHNRSGLFLVMAVGLIDVTFARLLSAANVGWADAGTDFSLGSNWNGGSPPADNLTGDIATFATAAPIFQPNLTIDRKVAGILFSNGAGAFTFSGAGTLTVGASGIVNADNSPQTLSLPVKLGLNAAFSTNSTGALILSGSVDTNGLTLTLGGNGTGASAISGVIGGAGGVVKSGTGTWTLSGANTFSGGLTLSAGTLSLGHNAALGTGAFIVNGGTVNASSARILANAVTLGGNATIAGSQAITFQAPVTLTGNRTLTVTNSSLTTLEGGLAESGGARSFTKAGTGSLLVKSSLGHTGATTLAAGTLLLDAGVTLSPGNLSMTGGTFGASGTISRSVGTGAGQIQFGSAVVGFTAYNGALTLNFGGGEVWGSTAGFLQNSTLTLNSTSATGIVTIATDFSLGTATRTITAVDNTSVTTDSSAITGNISGDGGLIKNGTGLLILSGANSYLGGTTLSTGTLRAVGASSLGDGSLAVNGGLIQLAGDGDTAFGRNTTIGATTTITVDRATAGGDVTHSLGTLSIGTFTLAVAPGSRLAANSSFGLTFDAATLTGNSTFTINKNGTGAGTLILGALSDGGATRILTKTGTGTLVLSAASAGWTAPGNALVINRGVVQTSASGALGGATAVTLNANAASATAALDLAGNNLTVTGITFGGTGAASTSSNTLATGAGTLTLDGGLAYLATGNPLGAVISGNVALSGQRPFSIADSTNAASDLTISAVISGSGGFTKTGAGSLLISGANTYSGVTQIQAGIVSINSLGNVNGGASALGNPTDVLAGTIPLGGGTSPATLTYTGAAASSDRAFDLAGTTGGATINAVGSGPLVLTGAIGASGSGAKTFTLAGTNTQGNTLAGAIADSGGGATSLLKTGAGNWILSGASTYSGPTQIQAGTVAFTSLANVGSGASAFGTPATAAAGTITLGNLTNAVALIYTGSGSTSDRALDLAGTTGTITITAAGAGALAITGGVTATGAGSKTLILSGASADENEIGGVIANNSVANKTSITKTGTGTWKLSGANTFSGNLTLSAGTLVVGNDLALGTGAVSLGGGILRGDGASRSLPNAVSLAASGVTIAGGSALTFLGAFTNALTANPTLNLTNSAATTFTSINLSNSATNRVVTIANVGDVFVTGVIANGGTSTAGGLTKSGAGRLTLSGVNTYAGATTISAGTLRATTNAAALGGGTLSLAGGTLELANDIGLAFNRNTTLTASSTIKVDVLTTGTGVTHTLGALTTATATLSVAPGSLVTPNTPYGLTFGSVTLAGNPFTLNVANNGSASGTVTLGALSNSAARGLTLNGPGTVVLAGASGSLTSGTGIIINGGSLRLGANNALGASALAAVTVNDILGGTAELNLNGFSQSVLSVAFGGTNATASSLNRISTGGGTLTLGGNVSTSATNNPLGAFLEGNISLGSANRTFSTADSINAATDLTVSAAISGTGGLIKTGAGRLDLTAANSYSGPTTLSAGTLGLGSNSALGSGSLTLTAGTVTTVGGARTLTNNVAFSSGANVIFNGSNPMAFNGTVSLTGTDTLTNSAAISFGGMVSGTGSLVHAGTGNLTLLSGNTYSGATTINGGTINAANTLGSATGSGTVTIGVNGTFSGTGTITGATTVNGTISPGGSFGAATGTLTTGNETWNGGGRYNWDLNDATGVAGSNWDRLALNGSLTIAATNASRFIINLQSLNLSNVPGNAANFSGSSNYSWVIATVTGSISGFAANKFTVNTASFTNSFPGSFSVSQSGKNLLLNYSAIPEPDAWAVATTAGLLALAFLRRRRN